MKKNTKIDYYEEEVDEKEEIVLNIIDRADEIDELLSHRPKVGEVEWKRKVNGLIERYNKDFGEVYNKIK